MAKEKRVTKDYNLAQKYNIALQGTQWFFDSYMYCHFGATAVKWCIPIVNTVKYGENIKIVLDYYLNVEDDTYSIRLLILFEKHTVESTQEDLICKQILREGLKRRDVKVLCNAAKEITIQKVALLLKMNNKLDYLSKLQQVFPEL